MVRVLRALRTLTVAASLALVPVALTAQQPADTARMMEDDRDEGGFEMGWLGLLGLLGLLGMRKQTHEHRDTTTAPPPRRP